MNTRYNISLGDSYIMAVEDSLVQAKRLKHFLDENNLNSTLFYNAPAALEAAKANPPILIISDIVMPGMDGYEFCKAIKSDPNLKEIPIIFTDRTMGESKMSKGIFKEAILGVIRLRVNSLLHPLKPKQGS